MKILFIQTGGTIDKDYPRTTKGYAFEISTPAVERILPKVNPNFEYELVTVAQKDSTELTEEDREKLLKVCLDTPISKILITHGTDTMIETAQKLGGIEGKAIIITGSMRPEKFSDSDAAFNIGVAIGALNSLETGIYIAMNGRVYPAEKCERNMETGQFMGK